MNDNYDKFKVIGETKKFISFLNDILINYPRKSFVLKNKLEETSYNLLELIYYTNLIEDRLDNQKKIISLVSMLDFFLETSYNNKYISIKKLNQGARLLNNIRKLTYGWVKINEG